MKSRTLKNSSIWLVTMTAVLFSFIISQPADAQGPSYLQRLFSSNQTKLTTTSTDNLGPSVQEIHRLATQMSLQVGWEVSRKKDSGADLSTLHKEMRQHSAVTSRLVKAYQGNSASDFQKCTSELKKTLAKVQATAKKTEVSSSVSDMIKRSTPVSTFLYQQRNSFDPKPDK